MMPLTADDMIRAVAFVDYGTVEQDIEIDDSNFRIAPGFGFRISVPALGPAPLAFDFAFPVAKADTDDEQMFSFFFGFNR
jgi:outer membrane protein insertion porin family